MSVAQIQEQILELSEAERIQLAEWLRDSIPDEEDDAYLQETIAIAQRRSEELRTGKVKGLTEEEFWARVNASKAERRA